MFQNGNLKIRKLEEEDKHILVKWLSDPAVLEFYEGRDNPFDLEKVKEIFYEPVGHTVKCIVEFKNEQIGYIQFYQLDDETRTLYGYMKENVYGLDQFIGEVKYWNRGIGTLLVTSMVKFLIEEQKANRVVMDPQTRNLRAVKCYENSGFKKIKLLPQRELHEGEYRDCWLMEYQ